MSIKKTALVTATMLMMTTAAVKASDVNPVFGDAALKEITIEESKDVVGKGYYADLFGYYGYLYSYYAYLYGSYGYYYDSYSSESAYYGAAYTYAYYSYIYYYYAYAYAGS